MKTSIIAFLLVLANMANSYAHYMWLETPAAGKLNTRHDVKIRFGEYTYGLIEKVSDEAFQRVRNFDVWLVDPDGKKSRLDISPGEDYYLASFVPGKKGTYTLALDNKNMEVLDYRQYDLGVMKPQYHAKAKVVVGETFLPVKSTNPGGIEIIDYSDRSYRVNGEVKLQVLFKGEVLPKNEVSIYIPDLWAKKVWTDENGMITFNLPWNQMYTVEAIYHENTPGSFQQQAYEYIWHCASWCMTPSVN
ncbi:DUF4198 domain-containing protein [Gaoshiqia sp. Z1-71]|uniref:DUF4198 domain-containing protein n=1 Tax=Gaoshiqia hydrogeniformans TaxID=3290090 RepID=UPI003BF8952E